jgi:hypothetical protein
MRQQHLELDDLERVVQQRSGHFGAGTTDQSAYADPDHAAAAEGPADGKNHPVFAV